MHISRSNPYMNPVAAPVAARTAGAAAPAASKPAPETERTASQGASLWDLLTPEEQAFFSRRDELGALTYGPRDAARTGRDSVPAPLGGRIDVKA
ncbi:MAG: hypothetical protein RL721_760 [Candidatus Eisenbacteria bacterium]|jgi:hypothetical protein